MEFSDPLARAPSHLSLEGVFVQFSLLNDLASCPSSLETPYVRVGVLGGQEKVDVHGGQHGSWQLNLSTGTSPQACFLMTWWTAWGLTSASVAMGATSAI